MGAAAGAEAEVVGGGPHVTGAMYRLDRLALIGEFGAVPPTVGVSPVKYQIPTGAVRRPGPPGS